MPKLTFNFFETWHHFLSKYPKNKIPYVLELITENVLFMKHKHSECITVGI